MKPTASYTYMDTRMLIRLVMFQIEDRPMVSCFLLEVVLLVRTVRNTIKHYQAQRQNTKVQQLLHVKLSQPHFGQVWG
jgi:hypothetical protein